VHRPTDREGCWFRRFTGWAGLSPPILPGAGRRPLQVRADDAHRRQSAALHGTLRCDPSDRPGPVVVDPEHRRHFVFAGSRKSFYHLGYTAYHLLDTSNDDAQIDARSHTASARVSTRSDSCSRVSQGYGNGEQQGQRVRRARSDKAAELRRQTGAGQPSARMARPAAQLRLRTVQCRLLAAGRPHCAANARVRHRATCIITIEKQDLPAEYGRLTEAEHRLYRYAIARLAAFDNVWWIWATSTTNIATRDGATRWGVRQGDRPYGRLTSVHAYADFRYTKSSWPDFIITQQYGEPKQVHDWRSSTPTCRNHT